MQFPFSYWGAGRETSGSLTYCPQNLGLFRQTPITSTSGSLTYCPQSLTVMQRP